MDADETHGLDPMERALSTAAANARRDLYALHHRLTAADAARAELHTQLIARRARNRAATVTEERSTQRRAIRAARAAVKAEQDAMTPAERAQNLNTDARRREAAALDSYRAALDYPLSAEEVTTACEQAVKDAKIPDAHTDETLALLLTYVYSRHGREHWSASGQRYRAPHACDLGRDWLYQRAAALHLTAVTKAESVTAARAAHAELTDWRKLDKAAARTGGLAGATHTAAPSPDLVWEAAENTAPTVAAENTETAAQLTARLELTERQTAALTLSLDSVQRVTATLSGAERKAAADALKILRRRLPTPEACRVALRVWHTDDGRLIAHHAALLAVGAAQRTERARATVAGYGTLLPGRLDSAGLHSSAAPRTRGPLRKLDALRQLSTSAEERAQHSAALARLTAASTARPLVILR